MNGEPKMRIERGEAMFDALPPADKARFEHEEFDAILEDLKKLPQEDQRNAIRSYLLATTEAMTEAYNTGHLARTSQEAETYHEKHDRLELFRQRLMRAHSANDE